MLGEGIAEIHFHASHLHRREEFSVRELRQAFGLAADAGKLFDVVVPGREVRIADRPIRSDSLFQVGLKVEIAPAIALPSPGDGFAANLAAANPGKVFSGGRGIGIVRVANKKLMGVFVARVVAFALDVLGALAFGAIVPVAILQLPDGNVLDVVALRNDGAASFEDQRVQAFFSKFFRGPAPGNSRANNNRVVGCSRHSRSSLSGVPKSGANLQTTMLRTGNDLELQFLSESDFGSVITVEGNVLEDGEEAALQLCIPLVRRIGRVTRPAAALGGDGVVHGEQKGQLLRRGRHDEILSKKLVASLVNIGETGEKILAVV